MKVLYLIQTHKNPEQIYRLVRIIKKSSPKSYVLVSHDFQACNLDTTSLRNLPDVEVISGQGRRADFSMVQVYLDAVDWVLSHNIEFDWLINLTGQDYPTQPLPQIEKFLAETKYDGFSSHFDVLSDSKSNPWGSREGGDRYLYQYWRSSKNLSLWQRAIVKLPRIIINNIQPFVRISSSFGLMVGIRAIPSPFNDKFVCYGGSAFHTLSQKCIQYLHEFSKHNSALKKYYQKTSSPEESFIQTILINSGLFNICNNNKRYMDFTLSRQGHPRILTVNDYSSLIKDNIHFARKFDMSQDTKILNMLDEKIL